MSPKIKHRTPKVLHTLMEVRTIGELGLATLTMPYLMTAPRGDKHPVLLLPGFMAGDLSTRPIRTYLKMKGYQPYGWKLGRNLGRDIVGGKHVVSARLLNRVLEIYEETGEKVTLIGWSLGGLLARETSRVIPEQIRSVITLGSPFGGPHASSPLASNMFRLLNGSGLIDNHEILPQLLEPLPVPTTAIFSRTDGITHWKACMDHNIHPTAYAENIEVRGSHTGLGHNPSVLWIIANRIAQPDGKWQPFDHQHMPQWLYAATHRTA